VQKKILCIKILNAGYKQRYASVGSLILVAIKSIKVSPALKVKKGEMHKALLIRTKTFKKMSAYNYNKYFENSVVLLNKQNKILGTRIFGKIPRCFKTSKFLKLITLSAGLSL